MAYGLRQISHWKDAVEFQLVRLHPIVCQPCFIFTTFGMQLWMLHNDTGKLSIQAFFTDFYLRSSEYEDTVTKKLDKQFKVGDHNERALRYFIPS